MTQEGHQKGMVELPLWSREDLGVGRIWDTACVAGQSWVELNPSTVASLRAGESMAPQPPNFPLTNCNFPPRSFKYDVFTVKKIIKRWENKTRRKKTPPDYPHRDDCLEDM